MARCALMSAVCSMQKCETIPDSDYFKLLEKIFVFWCHLVAVGEMSSRYNYHQKSLTLLKDDILNSSCLIIVNANRGGGDKPGVKNIYEQ